MGQNRGGLSSLSLPGTMNLSCVYPSPQVSLGNKERSKGVFYKALQNCPWAKVSPEDRGVSRCPGTFLPRVRPPRVCLACACRRGQGTPRPFFRNCAGPVRLLPLRWSWCFGAGGAAAAGVPVCPGLSPGAASIGSYVPGLPCRAQVRYSAVKLVETAVSARKFWSPLSPLPFTVPEFSVLPEVCPGAAGVRAGKGRAHRRGW